MRKGRISKQGMHAFGLETDKHPADSEVSQELQKRERG